LSGGWERLGAAGSGGGWGGELMAEFSMAGCGAVIEEGDWLTVRPGHVEKLELEPEPRVWAAEELGEIMRRARERSRRLGLASEPEG
jgi:hypothetical protein